MSAAKMWGDCVTAQYKNVMDTFWHVEHHLRNPEKPDLSLFDQTHESYINHVKGVSRRVEDIIEKAKELDRKDFEVF